MSAAFLATAAGARAGACGAGRRVVAGARADETMHEQTDETEELTAGEIEELFAWLPVRLAPAAPGLDSRIRRQRRARALVPGFHRRTAGLTPAGDEIERRPRTALDAVWRRSRTSPPPTDGRRDGASTPVRIPQDPAHRRRPATPKPTWPKLGRYSTSQEKGPVAVLATLQARKPTAPGRGPMDGHPAPGTGIARFRRPAAQACGSRRRGR